MQSTQGFYKFKKTVMPKVFNSGYISDTVVRFKEHYTNPGYSYVISTAGDMITSLGKNLADVSVFPYHYQSSTLTINTTVSSDGEITIDTDGTVKTSNSQMSSSFVTFKVSKPCNIIVRLENISGIYYKANDPTTPITMGHQLVLSDDTGESVRVLYSGVAVPAESGVVFREIEVTEEDIENGVCLVKIRPWVNGTTGGGAILDNLTYTMMVWVGESGSEFDYEQYVKTTKVCDNSGHCYIKTYHDGTVYSESGNTISVDYPKSEFATKFRIISDRVQNIDAADTGTENRKIYFFGDSITAGSGASQLYHMWLSRYTGMKSINWGHGGAGYLREDTSTAYSGNGHEGRGDLEQQSGNNTVLKTMQAVVADIGNVENCFIAAGTNEFGGDYPLTDFRTAVQNTLDYAQTVANRILVLTPIRRPNYDTPNTAGAKLHEYSEVIIEECAARGIPYIDGFDIPMNPNNSQSKGWYYSAGDGLHPSNNGHKFMAGWILDKFKAVFKV